MRNWGICLILAGVMPAALSAQSVDYHVTLSPGEVVLNIAGTGSYAQRGNIALLSGQMVSDAASLAEAEAMNQQNFEMLVNSLGTMAVSATQIRKARLAAPGQPTAGQARSAWQVYVELFDQSRMGDVVSALEAAEVRAFQPTRYDVSDRDALMKFARQRALDDARRQAEAYASALTLTVRRAVRVEELTAEITTSGGANDGDVVATARIKVDFLMGPMFVPAAAPPPGTP